MTESQKHAQVRFATERSDVFIRLCCEDCGVPFGVSQEFAEARRYDDIYCPNGHCNDYDEPGDEGEDDEDEDDEDDIYGFTAALGIRRRETSADAAGPGTFERRIGDRERDVAIARLTDAFASGHLTHAEHDQRCDAVLAAKSQRDLTDLVNDLPPAAKPSVAAQRSRGTVSPRLRVNGNTVFWFIIAMAWLALALSHFGK